MSFFGINLFSAFVGAAVVVFVPPVFRAVQWICLKIWNSKPVMWIRDKFKYDFFG